MTQTDRQVVSSDDFVFDRTITKSDQMEAQILWVLAGATILCVFAMLINLNILDDLTFKYGSAVAGIKATLPLKVVLTLSAIAGLLVVDYMVLTHFALFGRLEYLIKERRHERSEAWVTSGLYVLNGKADNSYFNADRYRSIQKWMNRIYYIAMCGGLISTFVMGFFMNAKGNVGG